MRLNLVSAIAALGAMLPLMTHADELSYSYLDPAYVTTDYDGFDEEVDGFALRGSLEVTDQLFAFAGYTDQSTDVFGEDLELRTMSIGGGYAWPPRTVPTSSAVSATSSAKRNSAASTPTTMASCSAGVSAAAWRRSSSSKAGSTTSICPTRATTRRCLRLVVGTSRQRLRPASKPSWATT